MVVHDLSLLPAKGVGELIPRLLRPVRLPRSPGSLPGSVSGLFLLLDEALASRAVIVIVFESDEWTDGRAFGSSCIIKGAETWT